MTSIRTERGRPGLQIAGVVIVALLSALVWFGWLGWDTEYQVDPATNETTGPYEAWQVVGCAASLLVLLVGAVLAGVRPLLASAALTLAFTATWTVQAAAADDSGLFAVGALMLLVGLAVSSTVISLVTARLRRRPASQP